MKKYLLYIMLVITGFTSCKRGVDPAPGERPEERVATALSTYSTTLTGSTNGWKAFLYPSGGGVYLFSMKFGTDNRVNMLSDINVTTSTTNSESSYRLRAQQAPSLLFDTYTYIHLLADPDPTVNGGVAGAGAYSDFEFYFDKIVGDSVMLIGNKLGSKLTLVKAASQAEYENFTKGTADILGKFSQLRTYFKRVTIEGNDCEVRINATTKEITFSYLVGGNLVALTSQFYIDGLNSTMVLIKPITIGSAIITNIKAITFDATNRTVNGTINGNAIQIRESVSPLKYVTTAATTFYNSPSNGSYWSSTYGFTIDGVQDGYKLKSIPNFSFLLYYPKYNAAYSRLGYIVSNAYAPYGPAPIAQLKADGTILFTNYGSFGTAPTAVATMVNATNAKWFDTKGFYVIQTGTLTYDLVAISDARAWMSFY